MALVEKTISECFKLSAERGAEAVMQQVNTLLYCLSEETESVLASTGLKIAPDTKYDAVMEKFDEQKERDI